MSGSLSIDRFFSLISSPTYSRQIEKIGLFVQSDKINKANNVKRQLPFFTATANYLERRLPESISRYNDLITIDIDGLTDEQVCELRPLIEQDPATIGCFLTAKQYGFKIIAHLVNKEMEELRRTYLQVESIPYAQLENYHEKAYEITRRHYEWILGVPVDTSGKDISRGIFVSYDPKAFYSAERAERVRQVQARIVPGEATVKRKRVSDRNDSAPAASLQTGEINPVTQMEFNKCVAAVQRTIRYEEGSHNTFLFALGNKCFRRGLDEKEIKQLAARRFGENGKWDTDEPINNAYTYTGKTEQAEMRKDEKEPPIRQVKAFIEPRYQFRRNTIFDRLEMRSLSPDDQSPSIFRAMGVKDLNTLFLQLQEEGINYPLNNLRAVIDSAYAKEINPIREYFDALPPWDGVTDYIGRLASTIQTTDQAYWEQVLKRWLVGMVASVTRTPAINQQAILLYGKQGKGKSTWIRNLLPPELLEYYSNGMINPSYKDDMLLLSTRMIINMEEFEGVKQADIAVLKRIISQERIVVRRPYDIQPKTYLRRASFIGSTNNTRFLSDIEGSRRFLIIKTREIDYHTPIDYTGLYAQALHLIENGFQYWFEGEEINEINNRNEEHRMKDPLEENLYVYFQPATPMDYTVKWKPAAAILSYLSASGRTQVNAQSQQLLIQVLERDGFMKRKNRYGITEYGVLPLTAEEIENNAKKPVNE